MLIPSRIFQCSLSLFRNYSKFNNPAAIADIYFIESTCADSLTIRQACSVESVLYHNPGVKVALKHLGRELNQDSLLLQQLRKYDNFHTIWINPIHRLQGSQDAVIQELYKWFTDGRWEYEADVAYTSIDMADAFRLIKLYQDGGLYLDVDILVLRELGGLKNVAGYEQDIRFVNNAVI